MSGVISLGNLKSKILKAKVFGTDTVAKAVYTTYKKVTLDTTLSTLNRILDREHFALVVHQQRLCKETKTWTLVEGGEPSTLRSLVTFRNRLSLFWWWCRLWVAAYSVICTFASFQVCFFFIA